MALTKVSGDFLQDGSITQGHLHASHGITTTHIAEGDKLFFTNARVDSRIGSLSSSDLSEGTNLYYTDARARAAISANGSLSYNSTTGVMSFTMPAQNTSNITEGTNLYYTDARVDARITAADTDSLSEGSTNLYYTDARADARVALIVDSAPGTLNTLNELAAALGDDANFSTTVTNSIATKWTEDSAKITNWDTAYGWGDHASGGYAADSAVMKLTGNQTISGTKTFDNGSIVISGTHGTISFMDTTSGEDNFYLHANSNNFYVLADRDATDAIDGGYESPHPLQLEGDTNTAYVFGSALNIGDWNTAYGWGNHASAGYLTSLPSHNHDDRYYTESEMQTFFNRGYINSHSATNAAVGWYTIATNTGDRALGEFQIWDTASSDHQSVLFSASHHFGTDASNDITVLANSRYSGTNFRYIRIKEGGTYDGAVLQVYIDGGDNTVYAAIVGGNAQESGWVLKDWIPDGTDPGDVSSYSSMTERTKVDLDLTINGGIITTGPIYSGGQTTQYRVLNTSDSLDADLLDGIDSASFVRSDANDSLSGQYTFTKTNDHAIRVGTIRGTAVGSQTGEFIQMYERVNIGGPTGWGASNTATPSYGLSTYGGTRLAVYTDFTESGGSMRAPIFYDSNDTAYYVNPNDTSSLRGIAIRGDISTTATDNQIFFYGTGVTTTSAIGFKANGGQFANPTGSGDGWNTYLTMDTDGRGWVFRRGTGSGNFTSAYNSGWILNNGIWQANASMRAPIFYDSNNTAFYVDPNGTSNLSTLSTGTNEGIFNNQRRNHGTAVNFNDTALRAGINYLQQGTNGPTGTADHQWYGWRLGLGGEYGTQTGSSGHYAQEWYIARKGQGGNNTGGNFLWTRDMEGGSWGSWAKIDTDRLQLASGYYASQGDWGLRNTTPYGWIQFGPANTSHAHIYTNRGNFYFNAQIQLLGGSLINQNDIRAGVFYDVNDTGYYLDPAGSSRMQQINISSAGAGGLTITHSDIRSSASSNWTGNPGGAGKIQYHSNRWYIVSDSSSNRIVQFRRDGGDVSYIDNAGRLMNAPDLRVPIYYDTDTSYYGDFASTTRVNNISCAGGLIFPDNYGIGVTGLYTSSRIQTIFNMGAAYKLPNDGASTASAYGLYWSHQNAGSLGGANNLASHGIIILENGGYKGSWGGGRLVTPGDIRGTIFYDYDNTGYYVNPNSTSSIVNLTVANTITGAITRTAGTSGYGHPGTGMWPFYNWGGSNGGGSAPTGSSYTTGISIGSHPGDQAYGWQMANNMWNAGIWYRTYNSGFSSWYKLLDNTTNTQTINSSLYVNNDIGIGFTSGSIGGKLDIQRSSAGIGIKNNYGSSVSGSTIGLLQYTSAAATSGGYHLVFQAAPPSGTDQNMLLCDLDGGLRNRYNEYGQYSDENIKENIVAATNKLEEVKQLQVKNFNLIGDNFKQIGLIAQDVEQIFPSLVKNTTTPDGNEVKSLKYSVLVPILIKAMQEQQTIIDDLKSRLETLENQ